MFTLTNVNGSSLLGFVFRNSDDQAWLFMEVSGPGTLAAAKTAAETGAGVAPSFSGRRLPAPPC